MIAIAQISALPDCLSKLAEKARNEGFHFIDRLVADFEAGINTFSKEGEALFEARMNGSLVGIGGLNRDPYINKPRVGRVRRLYVDPDFRRAGVATLLMKAIERAAQDSYSELRLLTDTDAGASFYTRLGYESARNDKKVSHSKSILTASDPQLAESTITDQHS